MADPHWLGATANLGDLDGAAVSAIHGLSEGAEAHAVVGDVLDVGVLAVADQHRARRLPSIQQHLVPLVDLAVDPLADDVDHARLSRPALLPVVGPKSHLFPCFRISVGEADQVPLKRVGAAGLARLRLRLALPLLGHAATIRRRRELLKSGVALWRRGAFQPLDRCADVG
jgi:hypothetical protein